MLLTQRSQPINLNLNFSRHRRHPASLSNISVHPHPSSTPGLLTLSKPIRQPVRNHPRPQSPRYNPRARVLEHQQHSRSILHPVSTTESNPHVSADAKLEQQIAIATPQHPRSRSARHKSTSAAVLEASPSPAVSPAVQRPSEPIPVPDAKKAPHRPHKMISRSDPTKLTIHTNCNLKRKDKRRRNKPKPSADGPLPLAEWDYPAPGSSDEGEEEERGHEPEPVTPIRLNTNERAWYSDGPKTAPLQGAGQFFFPSNSHTTRPEHRRAPSQPASLNRGTDGNHPSGIVDGIFHLSLSDDEEISDVQKKMALLFGTATPTPSPRKNRASTPSPRKRVPTPTPSPRKNKAQRESVDMSGVGKQLFANPAPPGQPNANVDTVSHQLFPSANIGAMFSNVGLDSPGSKQFFANAERQVASAVDRQLFASSSFQIAPEPVDLPRPSFLHGVAVRA